MNVERLPERSFDLVAATGAIHHVEKVDHCLGSVAAALKPGGLFILNDYFGPARMQWSDTQARLCNELLRQVPAKWRLRDEIIRYTPEQVAGDDPSETVSSDQIEDAVCAWFTVVERHSRGGELLGPMIGSGCLDSAMADDPEGKRVLATLAQVEADMIDQRAVRPQNFFYVLAPRRGEPLIDTLFRSRSQQLGV